MEALTSLYRRIFNFLVVRAGPEPGQEREIAAALESVFPRIGLKAFTSLAAEDKVAQLYELADIVLGIRLFNRHIGKGGAGIKDVPRTAAELVASLVGQVGEDLEGIETLSAQYVDVVSHMYRSGAKSSGEAGARLARLQQELANRRQYLAYLSTLYAAFKSSGAHVEQLTRLLLQEMEALKQLVGSRSSVPKEQVYPRFDSLAKVWATFNEELRLLQAREATLAQLRTYTESYVPTLRSDDLVAARSARRADSALGGEVAALPPAEPSEVEAVLKAAGASEATADGAVAEEVGEEEAAFASLELEGYCPVTLAQRGGLLLLAKPGLVVRYRSRYYGCVDLPSVAAFLAAPDAYLGSTLEVAKRAPELIHLLRLQEHFPAASIQEIMRQGSQAAGGGGLASAPQARHFQDSCVQTATHVVEKRIDPSYEWNEWALRRRALDLANLRKKATHSTQTVASSMRREAETQVYLPKEEGTMTGVSSSTAVPVTRNYIAGLRGAPDAKMAVVNLTVDPQTTIGRYR